MKKPAFRSIIRMDQTTAWLAGIFSTGMLFLALSGISKWLSTNYEEKQATDLRRKIEALEHEKSAPKVESKEPEEHDDKDHENHSEKNIPSRSSADTRWSYSGSVGPNYWSEIHPDFKLCGAKTGQSPVDIENFENDKKLKPLEFKYKLNDLTLQFQNGRVFGTVSPGSYVVFEGDPYDLQSVALKTPSEHAIKGLPYEAELQLNHADHAGKKLILSVLFLVKSKTFRPAWVLPKFSTEDEFSERQDLTQFLPTHKNYYFYKGSATEPPCGPAMWLVLSDPKSVDKQWIDKLILLQKNAARPVQPLGYRRITRSTR